jgi:hypothetical protein
VKKGRKCKRVDRDSRKYKEKKNVREKQTHKSKVRPSIHGGSLLDILFHHEKRQLLQVKRKKSQKGQSQKERSAMMRKEWCFGFR